MSESNEIFHNGKVSMEGTTATITFRRHFPYPISSVWSELTDPKKREKWFGRTRIDLTGEKSIAMTAEHPPLPPEQRSIFGRILVWDPPRVFEHEYSQAGIGPTVLRYELEADGDSTLLTLIHRGLELANVGHDVSCMKGIECVCERSSGIPFEDLVPGTVSREIYADLAKYFYQTTLSVIDEFMRTLDYWTFEKRSHSYRVARQSVLLGTHMGMGRREIFLLGAGALLHDIGKIRVPREILMNTGGLSDADWEILKQHPVFGEQILNQFHSLRFAWEIVTQHHEQWDGAGY
ncbi:MAG: HD domain-containing protein, partial [Nitrospirota bacterium]|nr:HD domain-containing protein [Nitrospirota bacterium]